MGKTETIRQLAEYFRREKVRNVVILTDDNVEKHYADYFSELSDRVSLDKIVLPAGEQSKSLETAVSLWTHFAEKQYDRDLFLLNFGGGMVCDLGGFVASTYKRGIRFANYPTTLLAMIDAAVGGKTGVNLHHIKNMVGTFYFLDISLPVDVSLLETLPREELLSGFGELVKYALIGSSDMFDELCQTKGSPFIRPEHVDFCVRFKQDVVRQDPRDQGLRHVLNFGHTFGHAIESLCAERGCPVPHGIAVAQGLYYESLLSAKLGHLPHDQWQRIAAFLPKHFDIMPLTSETLAQLTPYMLNDKKNRDGFLHLTLLDRLGHAIPDFPIDMQNLISVTLNLFNSCVCDTPLRPPR